ncbi:MAG: hypothetical protein ACRD2L_01050 [Terriglobia bacterium]
MSNRRGWVSVGVALLVLVPIFGQEKERPSLGLGPVIVSLGMSKSEALKECSDKNLQVVDMGSKALCMHGDIPYFLSFTRGKLSYADREWYDKDISEIDAVLGALGSLADKRSGQFCEIIQNPILEPDVSGSRVTIICGQRSVFIGKFNRKGKLSLSVSESIGELSSKKED